jgi:hypothetical protein
VCVGGGGGRGSGGRGPLEGLGYDGWLSAWPRVTIVSVHGGSGKVRGMPESKMTAVAVSQIPSNVIFS